MEAAGGELHDPALESHYAGRQIHGMVLLADDLPDRLERARRQVERRLSRVAQILTVETGRVLRDSQGEPIEPFGYRDGLSQPLFLQQDIEAAEQSHGGALRAWHPEAPLSLALVPDRLARQPDSFGSYLVFRKLEQDVQGFRGRLAALAAHAGHGSTELAGAMAVGRFEDGTPVLASATPQGTLGNDFNYRDSDSSSHAERRCPFHAHIRKMNPRGESAPNGTGGTGVTSLTVDEERSRRIVRRGVPYEEIDPQGSTKVGLLFLCFQNDISQQFAFLQKNWANNPSFSTTSTGRDPLIGRPTSGIGSQQRWPIAWSATAPPRLFSLLDFVRLKGGEFFFAPSIPFLRGL
jgi:Dyp-type peroxidase family